MVGIKALSYSVSGIGSSAEYKYSIIVLTQRKLSKVVGNVASEWGNQMKGLISLSMYFSQPELWPAS